jgi:hypothetical protein
VEHWEKSARLADEVGDRSGAHNRAWILVAHYFGATPASQVLDAAIHARSALADVPSAVAEVLWTVSSSWAMLGDLDRARAALDESRQIHAELGRASSASHYLTQVEEEMHTFCGDPHERVAVLQRGLAEAETLQQRGNPLLRALLAKAYADVGADEEAWSQALSTREALASAGAEEVQPIWTTPVLCAEAAVRARRGDDADALALAHEALEALQESEFFWLVGDAQMTLAEVHRLAGRRAEAATAAADALERFEHKEIRRLAEQARQLLERSRP